MANIGFITLTSCGSRYFLHSGDRVLYCIYLTGKHSNTMITGHILEKENLFTQSDVNMQDTFQIKVKQKLRFQV